MATLAPNTPPTSPPFHRRRKSWARKVERCCWSTLSFFPLTFVYGLTSWAVWVEVQVSFFGGTSAWAYFKAALGVLLYALLNVSYTTAVFTSPGSPLDERIDLSKRGKGAGYEGLPQYEDGGDGADGEGAPHGMTMVTAKSSDGKARYCKKCACLKPDRTHHCSTCGRCVLKMDHHCPWLATCVGLRNYKAFLLFLIYTSLFCWLDLAVSGTWVWAAVMDDRQMHEGMRVVNTILLAVLGGIIGLVLSGFTSWHIYLAVTGQTTIESLEKTRYLSPIRKNLERQFQHQSQRNYIGQDEEAGEEADGNQEQTLLEHLKETHANALPSVLRPEEGEGTRTPSPLPAAPSAPNSSFQPGHSPAKDSLHRSYASLEAQREHERYSAFLDEQDSEKLPNAFNLGWKRNLLHVFGERPLFWALPVCNTSGDGWMWEISGQWTEARGDVERERRARAREEAVWQREGDEWGRRMAPPAPNYRWQPGQGFVNQAPPPPGGIVGSPTRRANGHPHAGSQVQMQPLDRRKAPDRDDGDDYDTSGDEEHRAQHPPRQWPARVQSSTANWNDVPDDFLSSGGSGNRSRSRGRPKGD